MPPHPSRSFGYASFGFAQDRQDKQRRGTRAQKETAETVNECPNAYAPVGRSGFGLLTEIQDLVDPEGFGVLVGRDVL